jgi:hypothetical protein
VVGDEFQSIYASAEPTWEVYREAAWGRRRRDRSITTTAQGHVLDLVNEAFGREFGDQYRDLIAAGEFEKEEAPADAVEC